MGFVLALTVGLLVWLALDTLLDAAGEIPLPEGVVAAEIERHFEGNLAGRTIALWGLAFKPDTDDMREASSRALIEALWDAGARVQAYDPVAIVEARRIYGERPDLTLAASAYDAVRGADALAIVTEWKEFRSPDFEQLRELLESPVIFDGRNLYDPHVVERFGLAYYAIGRGRSIQAPKR